MAYACNNCWDRGQIPLYSKGRIYEYRKCPLCTCKLCDGTQHIPNPDNQWKSTRCSACHPGRFDGHVQAYHAKEYLDAFINPPTEYYERVYRRCLNPFQRLYRWITHNTDGSKRK